MFEKLKEAIKDYRIMALALVYISFFFHFANMEGTTEYGYVRIIDFVVNPFFWSGKLLFLLPIAILGCVAFLSDKIDTKKIFLGGAVLGILISIYIYFVNVKTLAGTEYVVSGLDYVEVPIKTMPALGFFMGMVVWIFIVVWTMKKQVSE